MEKNWWPYVIAAEAVLFLFFWWSDPYIAWLLTCVLVPIFWSVGLIAWIAEKLEKTKIHNRFFSMMFGLGLLPFLLGILFLWLDDFTLSWMK